MYCDNWLNENTGKVPASAMSSESISQLFQSITTNVKFNFFQNGQNYIMGLRIWRWILLQFHHIPILLVTQNARQK
jgi:hypothetical protein